MSAKRAKRSRGPGRPPLGLGSTVIGVRVHDDLLARITRQAKRDKCRPVDVLRRLAEEHLP